MAHKQDAPSEPFALADWQLLEVAGVDAGAFLQAQLMNDVRALAPGHWQWNGWLNPKGRVIALFALVALDEQRYWLLVPDFPAADLAARLQRFVFRSKLAITARADREVLGQFATPQHAMAAQCHLWKARDSEDIELDLGAEGGPRTIHIRARREVTTANPSAGGDIESISWHAFDLAHGLPRLSVDQSEAWTPQMLSLDRLNAYSLKKGCYPGQEIVARTHYLGQAKRGLVRIEGTGLEVGADVRAAGRVLGSVVSCVDEEALAVLSVDRPPDNWESAGVPCHELPLLGGLER